MKAGENYPSDNAQHSPRDQRIAAMDQDNSASVLDQRFSPDSSNYTITGTRCSLANGLEIAIVVVSQTVGNIEQFTAIESQCTFKRCTKTN